MNSQGYRKPVGCGLCLNILEVRADSGFYRVLLKLGQVCRVQRVQEASWQWSVYGKPIGKWSVLENILEARADNGK